MELKRWRPATSVGRPPRVRGSLGARDCGQPCGVARATRARATRTGDKSSKPYYEPGVPCPGPGRLRVACPGIVRQRL